MSPRFDKRDLDGAGIFANLDAAAKSEIAEELEPQAVARGETLIRQGATSDALYIVVSGRFGVTRDSQRTLISEIGPGQPIGEIGFLTGATRTATVTALRDSLVLKLERDDFDALAKRHPGIWPAITATLAGRLAATTAAAPPPPDPRPRTITLIPAGPRPLDPAFTHSLTRVFERHARTLIVTADNAKRMLGASTGNGSTPNGGTETTQRLNALERDYDYVLFVADDTLSPWSEKAIGHADLVVAAAHHRDDETMNALERRAADLLPSDARRLVLLHSTRTRLSGTARWLTHRPGLMHHHAALDTDADIERLFRFISGEARGLVACGGGAFCPAHLGVYKALVEDGLEFDILGGTSGGSAMTAAFLLTDDFDEMDAVIHDMFVTHKALRRYTVPRYSLIDHSNFDAQLKRHFGGPDIEDLWLPLYAVSTNLSRYTLHIHEKGSLWTAIRASAAIPVLLPPVYTRDGEMLVDGCLLDNVPIRHMHELKSGPNVVVSFNLPELERFAVDYETLPSRGELLKRSLNPLSRTPLPPAPGLSTVLMRSLMANRHDFSRHLTPGDLLLVPTFPADMGLLDWHRHTEMLDRAYDWTRAELDRLKTNGGHPAIR